MVAGFLRLRLIGRVAHNVIRHAQLPACKFFGGVVPERDAMNRAFGIYVRARRPGASALLRLWLRLVFVHLYFLSPSWSTEGG